MTTCAWCGIDDGVEGKSHGICPECLVKYFGDFLDDGEIERIIGDLGASREDQK